MIKHKMWKNLVCGFIVVAIMCGAMFCNLPLVSIEQKAYAKTEVSTYEALQEALVGADENTEIVVTERIDLPDGANLDGNGATVRVVHPYISEDGIVRDGEKSEYIMFRLNDDGKNVTIRNMVIIGGRDYYGYGAIYNYKCNLTMENVTIMRSYRGLMSQEGTTVLKNCNIVRNVHGNGSGIFCVGGKIIMDGCSLSENYTTAVNGGGGALEIKSDGELYANNCVMINNSSSEIGGAINCYAGAKIWLANCTISGNVTTKQQVYYGGGIGLNSTSGGLYAVNTIIDDNYQIVDNMQVRSDIGYYNETPNNFVNCLYGEIAKKQDAYEFNNVDCKKDTTSTFAVKYRNNGVLIKDDEITIDFAHPAAATKIEGVPALYVPVKSGGAASTGGVKTYFDYSDLTNIKMGYGEPDAITALGGLEAPESQAQVTTYYEGGTRANGIIGASLATNVSYYTVTLAKGYSHGTVYGATVYGDTYLEGTPITVEGYAEGGYMLEYWVAVGKDNAAVLTVNPYSFDVAEDITLVPVFTSVPTQYTITVSNGTASAASSAEGETVTVIANAPEDGYEFYRWTGEGVTFADANSATTTFVMPASEVTITATYVLAEPETPEQSQQELPLWATVMMVFLAFVVVCLTIMLLSTQKFRTKRRKTKKKK